MNTHSHAFFDLDGTIYVDGVLVPGVRASLEALDESGTKIFYMTNNTSIKLNHYYKKIKNLGLPVNENSVVSPVLPLCDWINKKCIKRFFAVGTAEFVEDIVSFSSASLDVLDPELVIVAFDKELSYNKVARAAELINKGVPWVITNIDKCCPTAKGPIPDCGSIADLIFSTTNIKYTKHFGKPSLEMIRQVSQLSENSTSILVAGDRIYTDVEIGLSLGATTVLVCTGEYSLEDAVTLSGDFEVHDSLPDYLNGLF
tara:strand:+ start:2392 stop:3162 length:771 start_codon:yes stop_codon:yes gene_type:complete